MRVIGVVQFAVKKAPGLEAGDRFVAPRPTPLYVEVEEASRQGRVVHLRCRSVEDPGFRLVVELDQNRQLDTWRLVRGEW